MSSVEASGAGQLQETKAPLRAEQETALEMLLSGVSMKDAAGIAGVSRMTLYRWLKQDAAFGAAYNQWYDEMRESCRTRLMTMTDDAANTVQKALHRGDPRTALQLLKGLGVIGERPAGPTDAEEFRRQADTEQSERRTALGRRERRGRHEEWKAERGMDGGGV